MGSATSEGAPATVRSRIFFLSPASCAGERARLLFDDRAGSEMAKRIREKGGAPLGDVFTFLSSLYFRGKLTYAREFAQPPPKSLGVWVITPNAGLCAPETALDFALLRRFAETDIDAKNPRYKRPLLRDARRVADALAPDTEAVLLGSVATGKYTEVLLSVFGDRLKFPAEFVGRGDMSRGGLLLRCVRARSELSYVPVRGATVHGKRPPKLTRIPG